MKQLQALTTPIAQRFVKRAPQGKHGDYVSHDVINQKALAIVGPHSFEILELIRGFIPAVIKDTKMVKDARPDGVVGVLARLTVTVDDRQVSIVEVGDEESPQNGNDGENAKKAASDAYKRCWMRLGLGLHLWSQEQYELPEMLKHYQEES